MDIYMLTTTDNPFSPVTHYDEWLTWDLTHGYCSNAFLARVAYVSSEMSDADYDQAVQDGIDEIVNQNLSGVHTKVLKTSEVIQVS